jgi:hypothetical protein
VLAHSKFKKFIHQSMLQETDMKQIDTFLKCLTQADPSFKNRRLVNRNVHEKGYVWQTEVRFDFQLFGSILFVDRLGRSLNKGLDVIGACHAFGERKSASAVRQEQRHCLSALREKTAIHQQSQDNRYKYNISC